MKRRNIVASLAVVLGSAVIIFVLLNPRYILAQLQYPFLGGSSSVFEVEKEGLSVPVSVPKERLEPHTLSIERLGIRAPIRYVNKKSEKVFQEALQDGVVHYPGTAKPGERGNAYIFGHSSDYPWSKGSYKTVFALLPKIQPDDLILVTNASGTLLTYRVVDTAVVKPTDMSVLDQGEFQEKRLTLQTSYPLGTALKRFIVRAILVES